MRRSGHVHVRLRRHECRVATVGGLRRNGCPTRSRPHRAHRTRCCTGSARRRPASTSGIGRQQGGRRRTGNADPRLPRGTRVGTPRRVSEARRPATFVPVLAASHTSSDSTHGKNEKGPPTGGPFCLDRPSVERQCRWFRDAHQGVQGGSHAEAPFSTAAGAGAAISVAVLFVTAGGIAYATIPGAATSTRRACSRALGRSG